MSTTYVNTINSNPIFADRATNDASGNDIQSTYAHGSALSSYALSADVSAYRVVSATSTQLYVGTAFLTSVNGAPVSASRAGNAANASMATSAWYDGTGRLISALPDKAAVSSIASGYVTGVSATVANNSASWGGGGGSVVSPSGTIFVSGSNIEGTNSAAVLQQTAAGFTQYLEKTYFLNEIAPYLQEITYHNVDDTGANLLMEFQETAHFPVTILISGRDSAYIAQSASSLVSVGENSASIPLGSIVQGISASASDYLHFPNGFSYFTAEKAGESGIVGVGELAWNSALTGVSATLANNSASWGGGVPASTVSSIASSYAESAASSKTDTSAMSSYIPYSALSSDGTSITGISGSAIGGGVITATGSGKVNWTGISSLNGSSIIAKSLSTPGSIMIGSGDPGMYLTGQHGTAYYKANEMIINRSGYGEQVKFNLGSAGSQVYGSATGDRGAFIQMNNDNHTAFLGALSGKDGIIELDGYSANSASMYAWDGVVDTVSSNSASWGQGGVDSATVSSIASSYAQDVSAAVSGTVDTVSSQSANWGGSALALSAGPGVKLEKVGDTLVASTDETVLWSGVSSISATPTIPLSEACTNFYYMAIYGCSYPSWSEIEIAKLLPNGKPGTSEASVCISNLGGGGDAVRFNQCQLNWSTPTELSVTSPKQFSLTTGATSTATSPTTITRIIGINRTAGV